MAKAGRVFSKIIFKANFGYCTVKRVWGGFAHTAVNEKELIMQQLPDLLQWDRSAYREGAFSQRNIVFFLVPSENKVLSVLSAGFIWLTPNLC